VSTPRTFKQLYSEVLAWTADAEDEGVMRNLAQRAIAASHSRRLAGTRFPFLLAPQPATLTLTAGQQVYALHDTFHTPLYFRNRTTGAPLAVVPYDMVAEHLPGVDASPQAVVGVALQGVARVSAQPATASVITATSSSVSDDGKQITITGDTGAGMASETLTLPNAGTVAFTAIHTVRKDTETWVGTVTLADASAQVLLTLGPTVFGRQFRLLRTLQTPASAEVIEYQWFRAPITLAHDYDLPDTPAPFDQLHVYDALLDLQGFTRATAAEIRNWEGHRDALERDLVATYQDGLAQDSAGSYVTYIPR
jgi:uncharacterized Zn-binding protein involved in type VI secretion